MRRKQRGAMSLLITTMLLIAALLFSLGASKKVFYQVKRAQNEVLARQAHWAAEGGLECAFAKVSVDQNKDYLDDSLYPSYLTADCLTPLDLQSLSFVPFLNKYKVVSNALQMSGKKQLSRLMAFGTGDPGAIKATANLYIRGSSAFSTPDPGDFVGGKWQCVAINYQNIFSSLSGAINQGVLNGVSPYADFDSQGQDCASTHMTTVSADTGYGNDFVQTPSLDPFYDIFKKPKSQWNDVRTSAEWNFTTITALNEIIIDDITYKYVEDCGAEIANKVLAGQTRIWVSGSCELTSGVGGGVETLSDALNDMGNPSTLLLIHNGLFSIQSSMDFPGLLMHVTTGFTPTAALWDHFEAKDYFGTFSLFPSLAKANTIYFQRGAFTFSGGQILDTVGLDAYFDQSLNFAFNRDNIEDVIEVGPPKWVEGSWHDF
ncbi:hypothetical protein [Thaumasiovibrio sp. DFM-14]|uniref:hypothetical protein n=1 Tax=Thaumasiovibrio sp. DFM-14 TaxID=3384792 RepID=UPI0039A03DE1